MRSLSTDRPSGKVCAILLAGPIFVGALVLARLVLGGGRPVVIGDPMEMAALTLFLAGPVIAVGAILSVAPVLLASVVLRGLGRFNIALRLPLTWSIVGAALAAAIPLLADGGEEATFAFAVTGATCAALACRGVRW